MRTRRDVLSNSLSVLQKRNLRSGDDEFFWCHHSCLAFLYIELTHNHGALLYCVVFWVGIDRMPADIRNFFGGGRQSQGSQSQSTPKKDVV